MEFDCPTILGSTSWIIDFADFVRKISTGSEQLIYRLGDVAAAQRPEHIQHTEVTEHSEQPPCSNLTKEPDDEDNYKTHQ